MEWFRFYDEVLDDPKVQRLPAALFRDWINILCLCNRNDPRGVLPSIEDVAFGLRCSGTKAKSTIKKLHEAGLLVTDQGVTYPNGWKKRQRVSDDVAKRVAEHRARNVTGNDKSNVTSNTTETLPHARATDTEQIQNRTEQTTASAVDRGADAPPQKPADKQKPKASRATQVPPDFDVTDALIAWGKTPKAGFSEPEMRAQVPKFVAWYQANGKPMKDWHATFQSWMYKSREFGQTRAASVPAADSANQTQSLIERAKRERAEYEQARSNRSDGSSEHSLAEGDHLGGADAGVLLGFSRRTG